MARSENGIIRQGTTEGRYYFPQFHVLVFSCALLRVLLVEDRVVCLLRDITLHFELMEISCSYVRFPFIFNQHILGLYAQTSSSS